MKTLFKFIGTLLILALVVGVVLHFLMPYIGEDWESFIETLKSYTTTATTTEKGEGTPTSPETTEGVGDSTPDGTTGETPTDSTPADSTEEVPADSTPADTAEETPDLTTPADTTEATPDVTTPETTEEADEPEQPEGTVAVTVTIYKQDPESGNYRSDKTLTVYPVEGWAYAYEPESVRYYTLNGEKSKLSLLSATEGAKLSVYYDCETCTVTFIGGKDSTHLSGELTQTLRKGQTPVAPTFRRYGYAFAGFDKAIAPTYENLEINAKWEILRHKVSLYVSGGAILDHVLFKQSADDPSLYEGSFTAFDEFFIPNPDGDHLTFLSWNTKADGSGTTYKKVTDLTAPLTLYAVFAERLYTMSFTDVEGVSFASYRLPAGKVIASPYISPEKQKAGHSIVWYLDSACTEPYFFEKMPAKDVTLYGKWVLDTGTGFLDWNLEDIGAQTVDSFEELVAFVDYIRFYDLTNPVEIEVTYTAYKNAIEDLKRVEAYAEFRANGSVSFSALTKSDYRHDNAKCAIRVNVGSSYRDTEATVTTPSGGTFNYGYLSESVTPRGDGYTDFYIDSLPTGFAVSTTNQLQYVVEHGYKPLPVAGSPADTIYQKARAILNRILPADATDLEKLERIFLYLTTTVEYDNAAVSLSSANPGSWPIYDAYFMEGVFNNQKAVCDGIGKAFSLLCNIEGIPAVEVTGTGHAWNRVFVNNRWFVVDATFGNTQILSDSSAITDHSHFMITDEAKKTLYGNITSNYPHIVADTTYDYFANKNFVLNGVRYTYVITATEDLAAFFEYLTGLEDDLTGYTVDFVYAVNKSFSKAYSDAMSILRHKGVAFDYRVSTVGGEYGQVCKLMFQ